MNPPCTLSLTNATSTPTITLERNERDLYPDFAPLTWTTSKNFSTSKQDARPSTQLLRLVQHRHISHLIHYNQYRRRI